MTKMLANNAVLELAKISAETAELQEKMQQATLFPTISAQVSYGVNQSQAEAGFLSASQQTGLNAGMNFNYNLFSGFQSQTQRQNTQIETLKAERRLDQVRETTENAVKNAIRMFDNATSVARLESENAEVSRQRFQKMDELFELGKASSLELREAQLAWLAAENGKSSAQFQAVNAQIALFQLMGSITSDGAVSVGAND
jgi:outer membrane protein TolC